MALGRGRFEPEKTIKAWLDSEIKFEVRSLTSLPEVRMKIEVISLNLIFLFVQSDRAKKHMQLSKVWTEQQKNKTKRFLTRGRKEPSSWKKFPAGKLQSGLKNNPYTKREKSVADEMGLGGQEVDGKGEYTERAEKKREW